MAEQIVDSLDPSLNLFMNLARLHAPLDRGEESDLLSRVRDGDRVALDDVVDANLRYVADAAMAVAAISDRLGLHDLCAEGTVALVSAVRRYDELRDGPFRPHVKRCIRRAMLDPAG